MLDYLMGPVEKCAHTGTQKRGSARRKRCHIEKDTEIELRWPRTKDPLEPSETGRGRKDSPGEPMRIAWPCGHPELRLLASPEL